VRSQYKWAAGRLAGSHEQIRITGTHCQPHGQKDLFNCLVPMIGTMTETVEGLLEKPEITRLADGVTFWWTDNDGLVLRQVQLAERVLTIALLFMTTRLHGH
jgi:hypothetical protein